MKIQAVRGMQDLLPAQKAIFRHIEDVARSVLSGYGYQEVGLPLLEQTSLFRRLVGEGTDIVEKEMYSFDDRNGDSLTLRPEGTAGCARLAGENGLLFNQVQRLWYYGPMFRHERPQKGRYRQFDQIGAECFGMAGPDIDAELLLMNARIWRELGIEADIRLELNSIGTPETRASYQQRLVDYLGRYHADLDEDSQRRLTTNPLRILDSKSEKMQTLLADAPVIGDCLDRESGQHFEGLRRLLDDNGLAYTVNQKIVRGLDYYNGTVFEWVTDTLGAQGTVCGGGRYDGLVAQLGGKPSPGIGFAMGLDRLALMSAVMPSGKAESSTVADVYVVSQDGAARGVAMQVAEEVRGGITGARLLLHCGDGKFKAQMKKADASGARLALILGEDEVANHTVSIKMLREGGEQVTCHRDKLVAWCRDYLSGQGE